VTLASSVAWQWREVRGHALSASIVAVEPEPSEVRGHALSSLGTSASASVWCPLVCWAVVCWPLIVCCALMCCLVCCPLILGRASSLWPRLTTDSLNPAPKQELKKPRQAVAQDAPPPARLATLLPPPLPPPASSLSCAHILASAR
jgi:hypothetical protein